MCLSCYRTKTQKICLFSRWLTVNGWMDGWMNGFSLVDEYASCMAGSPATQLIWPMEGNFRPVQNPGEPLAIWEGTERCQQLCSTVKSHQCNHYTLTYKVILCSKRISQQQPKTTLKQIEIKKDYKRPEVFPDFFFLASHTNSLMSNGPLFTDAFLPQSSKWTSSISQLIERDLHAPRLLLLDSLGQFCESLL